MEGPPHLSHCLISGMWIPRSRFSSGAVPLWHWGSPKLLYHSFQFCFWFFFSLADLPVLMLILEPVCCMLCAWGCTTPPKSWHREAFEAAAGWGPPCSLFFPAVSGLARLALGWPGQLLAWQCPTWVRFVPQPWLGLLAGLWWVLGTSFSLLLLLPCPGDPQEVSPRELKPWRRNKPCCRVLPPFPMHTLCALTLTLPTGAAGVW